MDDEIIVEKALEFARENKKRIARERTKLNEFPSDKIPVSVFMAGSPGAGKTEAADNLIILFKKGSDVLHIDPDDLREEFEDYNGRNSSLFMSAASVLAEKIQDIALNQKQSFIFDGTLSNFDKSKENIQRSIGRDRPVYILYVYQEPTQAWEFVQAREKKDGRHVPAEAFISKYFEARVNVNALKEEFGKKLEVDLLIKNNDGTDFKYYANIDIIDNYIAEKYSKEQLEKLIV